MAETIIAGLTGIVVLGVAAEWLAWRIRLPTIFILLVCGVIAGPVTGWLHPDTLLGDLLMPVVGLCVAVILFEGGLTLRFRELRSEGRVVWLLITLGVLVTWVLAAAAARWFLGFSPRLAALQGAILVVTGPTVIGPLLAHVRPRGQVASILKWEGITIDPVGAALAVLVFEALFGRQGGGATAFVLLGVLRTLFAGCVVGLASVGILILVLYRRWIPEHLHNPVSLAVVLAGFTLSNALQHESGLLTVTIAGAVLANQRYVNVRHVVEFKENLRVLLLSSLFIILAARIDPDRLRFLGPGSLLFLVALMALVRPAGVFLCTLKSGLSLRERAFLAYLAPRGVVAAAVASVFALRLTREGTPGADALVPVTFLVIAGTVAVYALTARPVARLLGLALPDPAGIVVVGAHRLGRAVGAALQDEGVPVLLIDRNWSNVTAARMAGLDTFHGDVLSERVLEEADLSEMGRLLALTPNDEVNALAALHFSEVFGKDNVYQLASNRDESPGRESALPAPYLRGQVAFGGGATYETLAHRVVQGAVIKSTRLTEKFSWEDFRAQHGDSAIPLFVVSERGALAVVTEKTSLELRSGEKIVALVESEQ